MSVLRADCLDYGSRVNALVNVKRNGRHFKRGMLGLACPDELRVKVWIVCVFLFAGVLVGLSVNQVYRRIVDALLSLVVVLPIGFFLGFLAVIRTLRVSLSFLG